MPQATTRSELIFVVQVALLMVVGRSLGEVLQRMRQPAVIGQLLAGVLLGPSLFGALWPAGYHAVFPPDPAQRRMLDGIAQLGVLMLLILTGIETDLGLIAGARRTAFFVSVSGMLIPFAAGFALGEALPAALVPDPTRRLATALFLGVALSISSVKIVATVIRDLDFMRRTVGQIIVGAAMLDDTVGWLAIAMIASLATRRGLDLRTVATSLFGTIAFVAAALAFGRRLVAFIIRWVNDNLVIETPVVTAILALGFAASVLTALLGVSTVLGAFIAGVLIGQSPILTRHIESQLRGLVAALFMPVFFASAGLSADLTILQRPLLAALVGGFVLAATAGKLLGGYIGGRLGGLSRREAIALAVGMNARGSTEVIVASIGLSLGVLSQPLFTMIVVMAIATTLAMPPTLRWAVNRIPLTPEEQERVAREAEEAKLFLPNVERVLIAVDGSTNGEFASRLGGLLVASGGMQTTVLSVKRGRARTDERRSDEIVRTAAGGARSGGSPSAAQAAAAPAVIAQRIEDADPGAVAQEAKKGYGLAVIGIADPLRADVRGAPFHRDIEEIAAAFEGPLAIVAANGVHLHDALRGRLDILVPVTGTDYSQRAAEVAAAMAAGAGAPLRAIYVSGAGARRRGGRADPREHEILRDAAALAARHGVAFSGSRVARAAPEDAIAREVRRRGHTLVVLGVKTRPGERLYFGQVPTALAELALCSLLLVRS
jgi:Kef-type K+ transport system membrane component KefB/nucleotide-binding universal stress UspA family protein